MPFRPNFNNWKSGSQRKRNVCEQHIWSSALWTIGSLFLFFFFFGYRWHHISTTKLLHKIPRNTKKNINICMQPSYMLPLVLFESGWLQLPMSNMLYTIVWAHFLRCVIYNDCHIFFFVYFILFYFILLFFFLSYIYILVLSCFRPISWQAQWGNKNWASLVGCP